MCAGQLSAAHKQCLQGYHAVQDPGPDRVRIASHAQAHCMQDTVTRKAYHGMLANFLRPGVNRQALSAVHACQHREGAACKTHDRHMLREVEQHAAAVAQHTRWQGALEQMIHSMPDSRRAARANGVAPGGSGCRMALVYCSLSSTLRSAASSSMGLICRSLSGCNSCTMQGNGCGGFGDALVCLD